MTEKSYVWGGTATGDADEAPYNNEQWALFWSLLLQYRRTDEGVIPCRHSAYAGNLVVTNPASSTVRVVTGVAIVDGRLYTNSANIDTDLNGVGTGWYTVVLRRSLAAQTVRVAFVGPSGGIPAVTQTDATWEISLATLYFDDATNTVSSLVDTRVSLCYPNHQWRQGGSSSAFGSPGTTNYNNQAMEMQSGVATVTFATDTVKTLAITFPKEFSSSPSVFVSVNGATNRIFATAESITTTGFTFTWQSDSGASISEAVNGHWLALGQR